MQDAVSLLPIVAIALLFWLLIIRPAQKRQKAVTQMQASITEGAEVMLTSGIFGTVREIADDHLMIEVADGVVLRTARAAVGTIVPVHDPLEQPLDDEVAPHDETRPLDPGSPSTHEER